MTDREKAKELGQKYQTPCHGIGDCEFEAYMASLEMAGWKEQQYQELWEKSVLWFRDIAELCYRLTSGNVSHLGATIRGKAIRAAEFIEKHKESKNEK